MHPKKSLYKGNWRINLREALILLYHHVIPQFQIITNYFFIKATVQGLVKQ